MVFTLILGNQKQYFYAGIVAIVLFSLAVTFGYVVANSNIGGESIANLTLSIQKDGGGAEFSGSISKEELFSGRQATLIFSPSNSQKAGRIVCQIDCQEGLD